MNNYESKINKLGKQLEEAEKELRIKDSFILNILDNWNHVRGCVDSVPDHEDLLDEADYECLKEAKDFTEDFATNCFRDIFDSLSKKYSIKHLEQHEEIKQWYWHDREYFKNKEKK